MMQRILENIPISTVSHVVQSSKYSKTVVSTENLVWETPFWEYVHDTRRGREGWDILASRQVGLGAQNEIEEILFKHSKKFFTELPNIETGWPERLWSLLAVEKTENSLWS